MFISSRGYFISNRILLFTSRYMLDELRFFVFILILLSYSGGLFMSQKYSKLTQAKKNIGRVYIRFKLFYSIKIVCD